MEIVMINAKDINTYKNNAKKHPQEQIEQIKNSILQFGLNKPLGVWGDNNELVYGHGTYKALCELHINPIPCIRLDHMEDEERRAYTHVDNQLTLNTGVDNDLLQMDLSEIDLDLSEFGLEIDLLSQDEDDGYYGDERERTANAYNLEDAMQMEMTEKWQMPIIKAEKHKPKDLISFNYMLSSNKTDKGIHFFIDDYQFERLWSNPYKYLDDLEQYDCVLTPDFSLYTEMPLPMQIWNIYRSRFLGQLWQRDGMRVIPTLQWCRQDSFEIAFDGIEQGGTVAVSTIGVKRDKESRKLFDAGMDEAIKVIKPSCIINYGGNIGYDYGDIEVIYIQNHNADKLKGIQEE